MSPAAAVCARGCPGCGRTRARGEGQGLNAQALVDLQGARKEQRCLASHGPSQEQGHDMVAVGGEERAMWLHGL